MELKTCSITCVTLLVTVSSTTHCHMFHTLRVSPRLSLSLVPHSVTRSGCHSACHCLKYHTLSHVSHAPGVTPLVTVSGTTLCHTLWVSLCLSLSQVPHTVTCFTRSGCHPACHCLRYHTLSHVSHAPGVTLLVTVSSTTLRNQRERCPH